MIEITSAELLGQWVRQERKAQGLTQVQVAGLCGVGVRFLHDLERGKASVHLSKVLDVLQILGLRIQLTGLSHEEQP